MQEIFDSEKEEILKAERRLLRALGFEVEPHSAAPLSITPSAPLLGLLPSAQ